jgi:predicted nuclease with TOPRIM domain
MNNDELLEKIRKVIREEVEAEAKNTRTELKFLKVEVKAGLNSLSDRVKDVEISNTRIEQKLDQSIKDNAGFFHETWDKFEKGSNDLEKRVTRLEGAADMTRKN